jgi:cytochrome c nitrite reductase small subunit
MRKEAGTEAEVRPGGGSRSLPLLPLLLSVAVGVLAGIGSYTFSYAKGFSYFSTDPRACVNCHIMQSQYDGWQKASHHQSAVCIDCHLPHDFIPKYLAKSENGWRHGKLFTTGDFVEPIVVKPEGREILEQNCVRCHTALTAEIRGAERAGGHDVRGLPCTHCHADAGHGSRAGLGGPLGTAELDSLSKHESQTTPEAP